MSGPPTSLQRAALEVLAARTLKRQSIQREKIQASVSTRTIRLPRLHAAQQEIKDDPSRFKVVNCGRRFGKDILCIDLLIWPALDGFPVGWFQPSYKSLLEVWRMMKRVLRPVTLSTSEQDKRIELTTGGIIDFWSLDGDPEACRGRKYKRVVINEAAKARYLQQAWEMAIRATLADFKGDVIFPSTPRGRDYYWQLFEKGRPGSDTYDPRWRSWQKPTSENPHIDPDEIADAARDLPTSVYNQEFLAQFLDVGGRFFDDWEPERVYTDFDEEGGGDGAGAFVQRRRDWHVCDPFPVPAHWEKWGGLDYGTTPTQRTFAFTLHTKDEWGCEYIIDEVYEAGMEAPEQAVAVLECLRRNELAEPVDPDNPAGPWRIDEHFTSIQWDPGFGYTRTFPPMPTSAHSQTIEKAKRAQGKYPVEYYWERGLTMCQEAVTDRVAGWRELKTRLHAYRVVKGAGEGGSDTTEPMLRVFRGRCSNLIRTFPVLIRSANNPEDIEGANVEGGERKQEDHLVSALRYGIMVRRQPSKPYGPVYGPEPARWLENHELPWHLRTDDNDGSDGLAYE